MVMGEHLTRLYDIAERNLTHPKVRVLDFVKALFDYPVYHQIGVCYEGALMFL